MLDLKYTFFGAKRLGRPVDQQKYHVMPTYGLVVLLGLGLLSLAFEVKTMIDVARMTTLSVDGATLHRGDPQFGAALERLQGVLKGLIWASASVVAIFGIWLWRRLSCRRKQLRQ